MSKTKERMRISASKMNTWMACPLQAKFRYVDHLPSKRNSASSFGACVHYGLNVYNETDDVEQAVAAFLMAWKEPDLIDAGFEEWTKRTSYGSFREKGIEMIRTYHEQVRWITRDVIAVEHEFVVPFGEYELHGIIDLIEVAKNKHGHEELRVIDYKTNSKLPYISALPFNVQFTTYTYAVQQPECWFGFPEETWERIKSLPARAYWYQLKDNREIDCGARKDDDFMRLYRVCVEMAKSYETGVYVPNISGDSCGFCPYKEPCGLPIPHLGDDD